MKGFSQVGSTIGRPLFADNATEERKTTKYARLCIEVDLKCKYPNHVDVVVYQIRAIRVAVEYNWRHTKCMECEVFGHNDSKCPKKLKALEERWATIGLQKKEDGAVMKKMDTIVLGKQTEVVGNEGKKNKTFESAPG
ncbi:hypothetical protein FRX31_016150, partial [Thalictrum thalictroides]